VSDDDHRRVRLGLCDNAHSELCDRASGRWSCDRRWGHPSLTRHHRSRCGRHGRSGLDRSNNGDSTRACCSGRDCRPVGRIAVGDGNSWLVWGAFPVLVNAYMALLYKLRLIIQNFAPFNTEFSGCRLGQRGSVNQRRCFPGLWIWLILSVGNRAARCYNGSALGDNYGRNDLSMPSDSHFSNAQQ